jgi:hypothetical protein
MRILTWLLTCFVVANLWWGLTTWPWLFHWNVAPPIVFNLLFAGMFGVFGESFARRISILVVCVGLPLALAFLELIALLVSACVFEGQCL